MYGRRKWDILIFLWTLSGTGRHGTRPNRGWDKLSIERRLRLSSVTRLQKGRPKGLTRNDFLFTYHRYLLVQFEAIFGIQSEPVIESAWAFKMRDALGKVLVQLVGREAWRHRLSPVHMAEFLCSRLQRMLFLLERSFIWLALVEVSLEQGWKHVSLTLHW